MNSRNTPQNRICPRPVSAPNRNRWVLWLCLFCALFSLTPEGRAHVGSPNAIFEGPAGPFTGAGNHSTPGVVPGLAQIDVRVLTNGAAQVATLPVHWRTGLKGSPPPDVAKPVTGDAQLFHSELWFMERGAYSVQVQVRGAAGEGIIMVPINSIATQRLPMPRWLGVILGALGLFLFVAAVTLVGAAVRESTLLESQRPTSMRLTATRLVIGGATVGFVILLVAGKNWWESEDRDYRNNRLFKAVDTQASIRWDETNGPQLQLSVLRNDPAASWAPLVPDHGKLMHAFLLREPGFDQFAHVHPIRIQPSKNERDPKIFEATLPPLPSGVYRVFADLTHETGFSQTLVATLTLSTNLAPIGRNYVASDPDDSSTQSSELRAKPNLGSTFTFPDDAAVTWDAAQPLIVGQPVTLGFTLRDRAGRPLAPEPYMGMAAHLILCRDDESVFTHLHPAGNISLASQQVFQLRAQDLPPKRITAEMLDKLCRLPPGQRFSETISFPYEFPQPGRYRFWLQFKTQGEIRTAVFDRSIEAVRSGG